MVFSKGNGVYVGYSGNPGSRLLIDNTNDAAILGNCMTVAGSSIANMPAFDNYDLSNYSKFKYPVYAILSNDTTAESIEWVVWIGTDSKVGTVKIYVNGTLRETVETEAYSWDNAWYKYSIKSTADTNYYVYLEFEGGSSSDSPYPVDPSEQGGGGGSGDLEPEYLSDEDEFNSGLKQILSANTFSLYTPSNSQLEKIKSYLYSDTGIAALKSLSDKIGNFGGQLTDYMFKCFHIPFSIDSSEKVTRSSINIGPFSAYVSCDVCARLIGVYDFGEITVPKVYGNALDYKSEIQLWLPFINFVNLDAAAIVGKTLNIKYYVDISSGDLVAHVHVNGVDQYQFSGNCAYELPLSSDNTLSRAISSIGTVISTVGSII